jgi:hypothetical protein
MTILIILAGVAMLAGYMQSRNDVAWGKPLAIAAGIVAMLLCLLQILFTLLGVGPEPGEETANQFLDMNTRYAASRMKAVAERAKAEGGTIVLLTYKDADVPVDVMKEALGGAQVMTHEGGDVTIADADRYISDAGAGSVLVWDIVLPKNFPDMKFWQMSESSRPKLIVARGDISPLGKAVEHGFVSAVVAEQRGFKYDMEAALPDDDAAVFAQRYLLIDASNLEANKARFSVPE